MKKEEMINHLNLHAKRADSIFDAITRYSNRTNKEKHIPKVIYFDYYLNWDSDWQNEDIKTRLEMMSDIELYAMPIYIDAKKETKKIIKNLSEELFLKVQKENPQQPLPGVAFKCRGIHIPRKK